MIAKTFIHDESGQTIAVVLPFAEYEQLNELALLLQQVEDHEDIHDMRAALEEYHQGNAIEAEQVFQKLGL